MCCVSKIYSSIINARLQRFLEVNELLVDEQNGFHASRSCIDHIFVHCTILRNRQAQKLSTFLTFVDFKKAFDSVDRNLLLFKLGQMGINGKIYKAISTLYANPRARVMLNEYSTQYFECPIGVKQGDCLSPTLFAIFINDLALEIKESLHGLKIEIGEDMSELVNILLYEDDIVLLTNNELDMQNLLSVLESLCKK